MDLPANHKPEWKPSLAEQQQRDAHREWIGGRAITLLSHYWRDDDDEALTAAMGADWADVLEGIPSEFIQRACIRYQQDEPRRKPTPGAIYQLARSLMPAPRVVPRKVEPQAPQQPCDPAVAQAICEAAGYTPRKFGESNE